MVFNTYQEVQNYLYSSLPMYQRMGAAALKPNLDNTIALCNALGNPQTQFKSIHIGGTNGKGSSSHAVAAVLQSAGYKTGLYTSPHLKHFSERIRVNGEPISENDIFSFVTSHFQLFEGIKPSFFEATVAMAFWHFQQKEVEVAVIEVGLGGRLDSTNIITPDLCLITNISWDHADLLGPTLQHIAREKAGIIKSKKPIIVSEYQDEVAEIFENKAKEMEAPLAFASKKWSLENIGKVENGIQVICNSESKNFELTYSLTGYYQLKNIPGILETIATLNTLGYTVSDDSIQKGLSNISQLTGLKGRWQVINQKPLAIADTAHNEAGVAEIVKQILSLQFKNLHIVLGMVNDKDHDKILKLLPTNAQYYFTQPQIDRKLPADQLQQKALRFELFGDVFENPNLALRHAMAVADTDDFIFIGGSTFVVADLENL